MAKKTSKIIKFANEKTTAQDLADMLTEKLGVDGYIKPHSEISFPVKPFGNEEAVRIVKGMVFEAHDKKAGVSYIAILK